MGRFKCASPQSASPIPPQLPADVKLSYFDSEGNMQEKTVGDLTKGKKVGYPIVWPDCSPPRLCSAFCLATLEWLLQCQGWQDWE